MSAAEVVLPITAAGHERLRVELEALRSSARHELGERLREAREDGDLADNPLIFELLEERAQLERRIATLEDQLGSARIVAPAPDGTAGIGSSVVVRDLATGEVAEYELVGPIDPVVDGSVSVGAPVGRALAGRRAGARVVAETPRGAIRLELLHVEVRARRARDTDPVWTS
jgi:transcription elongation factor GreA